MKVLIIRFSSIGDVVLTSPVIRCLKKQEGVTVHYLIKHKHEEVIKKNLYIDKIYLYKKEQKREIKKQLYSEKYDYVIDLQNNLKSFLIRRGLGAKNLVVNKKNIKKWVLINTGVDLIKNEHIVERYFKTIKTLGIKNDEEGLDYFINKNLTIDPTKVPLSIFNSPYITWAIGATYAKKKLSSKQILEVVEKYNKPVILLGGKREAKTAEQIVSNTQKGSVYNLCGKLSLEESSYLIMRSDVLLTNDTGLMHIACAFKKKIISFWGCTKPSLGMNPYKPDSLSVQLVSNPHSPPCSKLGNRCRKSQTACINEISSDEIYEELIKITRD